LIDARASVTKLSRAALRIVASMGRERRLKMNARTFDTNGAFNYLRRSLQRARASVHRRYPGQLSAHLTGDTWPVIVAPKLLDLGCGRGEFLHASARQL